MTRAVISAFLISFTGWTLSAHACVLLGLALKDLLLLAPVVTIALAAMYIRLPQATVEQPSTRDFFAGCAWASQERILTLMVPVLLFLPIILYWSWNAFWLLSVASLTLCLLVRDSRIKSNASPDIARPTIPATVIIALLTVAAIVLSYAVSRSDLDDAFYVAVAAFSASHPGQSLLATDPMLGETGFPLLFPSYRFSSFELLSAAIGYLLSIPVMDAYYIYLLPLWVVVAVAAVFLLTREMLPEHWLLAGVVTLLLILLLGEMHRSPANFSFVRLFQGKAILLSVIVPTVFYLTARLFSERGTRRDLFLLGCCQITAIGLSNFGMLTGPLAGFIALVSNIPRALQGRLRTLFFAFVVLLLPLPYLIAVALQSQDSPIINLETETAVHVWGSVFGTHQQYLVGMLLLAGPVLARDRITRWRLAVPPLFLFAIFLNPWLSALISKQVTTPPVYWRVIWFFPMLIFIAVTCSMITIAVVEQRRHFWPFAFLFAMLIGLTLYALPFHSLRSENIDASNDFAAWKIPGTHRDIAVKAIQLGRDGGRLLAPDEIAGVISRFEEHPRLIATRGFYLDIMPFPTGESERHSRRILYGFVTGQTASNDKDIRLALRELAVTVVVMHTNHATPEAIRLLQSEGYTQQVEAHRYSLWTKR